MMFVIMNRYLYLACLKHKVIVPPCYQHNIASRTQLKEEGWRQSIQYYPLQNINRRLRSRKEINKVIFLGDRTHDRPIKNHSIPLKNGLGKILRRLPQLTWQDKLRPCLKVNKGVCLCHNTLTAKIRLEINKGDICPLQETGWFAKSCDIDCKRGKNCCKLPYFGNPRIQYDVAQSVCEY